MAFFMSQAYCDAAKDLFGNFANDGIRNLT
jgi:hypothetical protein